MANKPPSDYRKDKFKRFFKFMDVNKDGFIDSEDFEMLAVNLARLSNASEKEAVDIRREWIECWGIVCGEGGHKLRMTLDEAIEGVTDFHTRATQQEVIEFNRKFHQKIFDVIDRNKDNQISREELGIFYKSFGVPNDGFIEYNFAKMDTNKNGFISRDEFINAQITYWCSDNPAAGFESQYDPSKNQD